MSVMARGWAPPPLRGWFRKKAEKRGKARTRFFSLESYVIKYYTGVHQESKQPIGHKGDIPIIPHRTKAETLGRVLLLRNPDRLWELEADNPMQAKQWQDRIATLVDVETGGWFIKQAENMGKNHERYFEVGATEIPYYTSTDHNGHGKGKLGSIVLTGDSVCLPHDKAIFIFNQDRTWELSCDNEKQVLQWAKMVQDRARAMRRKDERLWRDSSTSSPGSGTSVMSVKEQEYSLRLEEARAKLRATDKTVNDNAMAHAYSVEDLNKELPPLPPSMLMSQGSVTSAAPPFAPPPPPDADRGGSLGDTYTLNPSDLYTNVEDLLLNESEDDGSDSSVVLVYDAITDADKADLSPSELDSLAKQQSNQQGASMRTRKRRKSSKHATPAPLMQPGVRSGFKSNYVNGASDVLSVATSGTAATSTPGSPYVAMSAIVPPVGTSGTTSEDGTDSTSNVTDGMDPYDNADFDDELVCAALQDDDGATEVGDTGKAVPEESANSIVHNIETTVPKDWGHWEIDRECIKLSKRCGAGEFGDVWAGQLNGQGETAGLVAKIAAKALKPNHADKADEFLVEAYFMMKIHHHNVVNLYGLCTKVAPVLIISELCSNGCLLNFLRKRAETPATRLRTEPLVRFMKEVCDAMMYLEANEYIHRDLAARNVLLDDQLCCKLTDFGLAKDTHGHPKNMWIGDPRAPVPVRWCAPEALKHAHFSAKSDVWSYGIMCYEIVTHGVFELYTGLTNRQVVKAVCMYNYTMSKPLSCPDDVFAIMSTCWTSLPQDRPSFKQLWHKFFC